MEDCGPAFQFYAGDFLSDPDQAEMSLEEVGAYARLLCHAWKRGYVPNDPVRCGRLVGVDGDAMATLMPALMRVFIADPSDPTKLINRRLEETRAGQIAYRAKQVANGKKGAEARWKHGDANGDANGDAMATPMATPMAMGMARNGPSSSPSPSSSNGVETTSLLATPLASQSEEPKQTVLDLERKKRKSEVLALLWPKVKHLTEGKMTRTKWGDINTSVAYEFARLGLADEEILAAYDRACKVRGQPVYMLSVVQAEMVKGALPQRRKPGEATDVTLLPSTVPNYESRDLSQL